MDAERVVEELENETIKWLERIKVRIEKVNAINKKGEEFLKNIRAYISDSEYFLEKGDLVRAFECVVWAWAWLEIGLNIGILLDQKTLTTDIDNGHDNYNNL